MIRREEGRKKLRIHIVQKGDTLWKIAKEYGISFEDLKRLNVHLANPDYIVPGMEIILPEKIHKETHNQGAHNQGTHKETQTHKEMPTKSVKESVKKEVQKPMPAPPIVAPPPMPMPEPQMIPIPFPMPMPMPQPMPQQPMWVPQPVELNWNQQLVMPQVEHPVIPPIQIQPPAPPPPPPPPPVAKPTPPVHIMPQMPMVPHCPSCHQPVHHQMWWHQMPMHQMPMHQMPMHQMPMHPQVDTCSMPQQPVPYTMPAGDVAGAGHFLESSTSPFFPVNDAQVQHHFEQMPEMQMGQSCGCGSSQPAMMPNWQFDQCNCPPPCPPPCPPQCQTCGPWMSPHFFPGGMTPYRW